jgi:hypothetical protein
MMMVHGKKWSLRTVILTAAALEAVAVALAVWKSIAKG